jgi:hypothetical protein
MSIEDIGQYAMPCRSRLGAGSLCVAASPLLTKSLLSLTATHLHFVLSRVNKSSCLHVMEVKGRSKALITSRERY